MKHTYLYSTLIFLCGCTAQEYECVSIGDPILISNFEFSPVLEESQDFYCDEIGINSVKVIDSLLILGHSTHWTLINMESGEKKKVLSSGQGPHELHRIPRCATAAYQYVCDSLISFIPDKTKGRIMSLNMTGVMEGEKTEPVEHINTNVLNNEVWDVVVCDTDKFLMSVPNISFTGFSRQIWTPDSVFEPAITKSLSVHTVGEENDINLLSRVTKYNKTADRFIEAMVYLNQINVFSSDGKYGMTVCVGDRLDNLKEIEGQLNILLKSTYINGSAWDCGFGAVYSGHSAKDIQTGKAESSEIQFFTWSGEPVYRCKFPFHITAFDMDTERLSIYVIDADNDMLRKYDASPVMDAYHANGSMTTIK